MKPSNSPKIFMAVIVIIIVAVLITLAYFYLKNQGASEISTAPTKPAAKTSGSPKTTPSVTFSPKISSTISPTPAVTPSADLKIPAGETYLLSSKAETNGDGKDETLVITQLSDGKYHAYILTSSGAVVFDDKTLNQKPLRIAAQKYASNENYLSWMLVFTEQSGNLAFIHWNGTKYEIPQNELGI